MDFDQYISHPGKKEESEPTLLIGRDDQFDHNGHLRQVADRMAAACRGQELADGSSAERVAEVIGLTHDFAKLTSWAQKHLRNKPFQLPTEYRYHAFPSSLVTLYCLSQCWDDVGDHAAEVATIVVAGHHNISSPPEPTEVAEQYGRLSDAIKGKYERVGHQFDDINDHAASSAERIIHTATGGDGSWQEFCEWYEQRSTPTEDAHDLLIYFAEFADSPSLDGYYADVVRLWTALKFADQTAASGLSDNDLGGSLPDRESLENHIAALDEGRGVVAKLNQLRDRAREDATRNVQQLVGTDDVGLITLPTGFGKTYAGLSAGLKMAELEDSRLVYVLPYTSILDQTAREIQSIFDVSPYSKEFTLHHHLSDTYTGLSDHYTDADIGRSPGALHAESWLSGLTLTTTVQLFESLAAPTARQATRIPSVQGAVVVIDEPQAIPENWWKIVPTLVELLVEVYDTTVIFMTATQPGLIEYGSDELKTQELTGNPQQYTDFLAKHPRVIYQLDDSVQTELRNEGSTVSYPIAGNQVFSAVQDGNDVLAVCNTRASAEDLYQATISNSHERKADPVEIGRLIHEHAVKTGELPSITSLRQLVSDALREKEANTVYAFLSGDVRPDDRSLIVEALYDDSVNDPDGPKPLLEQDTSVILISTSVVEAGVDISFDIVFRDYAPIPNIVQSGGRCNRSFGGDVGKVIIWRLAEPEDAFTIPSIMIHGSKGGDALPLLRETGQVLQRHATNEGEIDEARMVSETVSEFYQALFNGSLDPGKEELAHAVKSCSMSILEREHMIQEIENYEDVIACLTNNEREDLLTIDPEMKDIMTYPGAQVNTDPESWEYDTTIRNSKYIVLDAQNESYHPVFGVK